MCVLWSLTAHWPRVPTASRKCWSALPPEPPAAQLERYQHKDSSYFALNARQALRPRLFHLSSNAQQAHMKQPSVQAERPLMVRKCGLRDALAGTALRQWPGSAHRTAATHAEHSMGLGLSVPVHTWTMGGSHLGAGRRCREVRILDGVIVLRLPLLMFLLLSLFLVFVLGHRSEADLTPPAGGAALAALAQSAARRLALRSGASCRSA